MRLSARYSSKAPKAKLTNGRLIKSPLYLLWMGGSDMQQEEKEQLLVKTARVNDGYLQQGVHL